MKRGTFKRKPYSEVLKQKQAKSAVRGRRASKRQIDGNKRKPKANRIKTLKRKLWIALSQHVRKSFADHAGYVTEIDTGRRVLWTETDCGHLFANTERNQKLGGNELWYDIRNYAPQSRKGNRFGADNSANDYMIWAVRRYGIDAIEEMRLKRRTYKLWTEEELQSLLTRFT